MKIVIDIPEDVYEHFLSRYKYQDTNDIGLSDWGIVGVAIKNGTPYETVTEFADRCKECGARYGKLLKQEPCEDCISRDKAIKQCGF